jgi:hypothetical protein
LLFDTAFEKELGVSCSSSRWWNCFLFPYTRIVVLSCTTHASSNLVRLNRVQGHVVCDAVVPPVDVGCLEICRVLRLLFPARAAAHGRRGLAQPWWSAPVQIRASQCTNQAAGDSEGHGMDAVSPFTLPPGQANAIAAFRPRPAMLRTLSRALDARQTRPGGR